MKFIQWEQDLCNTPNSTYKTLSMIQGSAVVMRQETGSFAAAPGNAGLESCGSLPRSPLAVQLPLHIRPSGLEIGNGIHCNIQVDAHVILVNFLVQFFIFDAAPLQRHV